MLLFQLIQLLDDQVSPEDCKIHLAVSNGKENPLDVYLAGEFDHWQEWQTQKNFNRKFVVSLISMPERNRWLFAGVHDSLGCKPRKEKSTCFQYNLRRRETTSPLCGRLIIDFERSGRNSYLLAKNWIDKLHVSEIRPQRLQVAEFPGYTQTVLTKQELNIIVNQQIPSWKSALSSISGVYIIADRRSGKLYVGSATGEHGIWGRWCQYAKTGHGNNKELRALLKGKGNDYASNFQYGILETADSRASEHDIIIRETHWKDLLLTKPHGYNAN